MRRREFLSGFAGVFGVLPLKARAQEQELPLVGFIGASASERARLEGFRQGLAEAGYIVGDNVRFAARWADGQYNRLSEFAKDFVEQRATVIVAAGLPAALAAKTATSTIPIVFASGADPVAMGLVPNLNRPEGNLTGVSLIFGELSAKRIELLREIHPRATLVFVLLNPKNPNSDDHLSSIRNASEATRQSIRVLEASDPHGIEAAFANDMAGHALLISDDPLFVSWRERLVELAARAKVPTIYFTREFVDLGGLVSYGPSFFEAYRQVGIYAGRILAGSRVAELPVVQPTKFELCINLRTANAIGLALSPMLLARADEVIE